MKLTLNLLDETATQLLAKNFASYLSAGIIIYLLGDLAAGKTFFVRSLIHALGYTGSVKSPTFAVVEPYPDLKVPVNHFDLYRINDPDELELLGVRDYITNDSVCCFEWAEKGGKHIPIADLTLQLDYAQPGRTANIIAHTPQGKILLKQLATVYLENH